jgi:peroxiredoxin
MPAPQVNVTAPDFTLEATTSNNITLSGALGQGPVVLVFYRFDFGPI